MNTTLTNDQITAGAAVLCDHGQPIGRNAAIEVFDAMQASASVQVEPPAAFAKRYSELVCENARLKKQLAETEPKCPTCKGNDTTAPCAYPSSGMDGCLRDKRLAPSPQIAEKVELPPLPHSPHGIFSINQMHQYARDAIAASRRASAPASAGQAAAAVPEHVMVLLRDAARAWNNESEHDLDAAMERIECYLIDSRAAQPAEVSAGQAGQVEPHLEPVGRVKDHFAGTDKAYRTVIWADRTFAMDVPDGAYLYAAPITERAAAPADLSKLEEALRDIKNMTDAENPESYRCDDREGCLDTVFATASNALASITSPAAEGASK